LSIYSYSTARLLSFLSMGVLMAVYFRKKNTRKNVTLFLAFYLTAIPFFIFYVRHPGALTARFRIMSYLYLSNFSFWRNAEVFLSNYVSHFTPHFLLLGGDANMRHATGCGGEIFITVLFLFIGGIIWLIVQKRLFGDRFVLFLFINLLLSPVAASLTIESPHALRSILLGLYFLIFSCYGLSALSRKGKNLLILIVFAALILESSYFLDDYFTEYGARSARSFVAGPAYAELYNKFNKACRSDCHQARIR
jgi:hypothetical protein